MEGNFEDLLPKELLVVILVNEGLSGIFNFLQTLSNLINRNKEGELILNLNKVITVVGGGSWVLGRINTARHHDCQRDEVRHNLVDDVTNTIFAGV